MSHIPLSPSLSSLSGEGVGPQEYTIVKLEVLSFPETSPLNHPALAGKKIYLAPATLRPETMYGQTNCFVLPEGEYGAFEFKNDEILIMSERAALGLAHQDYALEWGKTLCHVKLTGQDLLGLPLKAPLAAYEVGAIWFMFHCLVLLCVCGVVLCVMSWVFSASSSRVYAVMKSMLDSYVMLPYLFILLIHFSVITSTHRWCTLCL